MSDLESQIIPVTVDPDGDEKQIECVPVELARELKRELVEAREIVEMQKETMRQMREKYGLGERNVMRELRQQRDMLAKALSMYGLPYTDEDLEHVAQNPSPHSEIGVHEAKRELIRRQALAAVKGGSDE
jgi:hypothetical protein